MTLIDWVEIFLLTSTQFSFALFVYAIWRYLDQNGYY